MLFKAPHFNTLDIPTSKVNESLKRRLLLKLGTWLSDLHGIDDVLTSIDPDLDRCRHQQALDSLEIEWDIDPSELEQIPREGPLLVVSNHAFGGADGLVLATAIGKRRPDFHLLTNFMLLSLAPLRETYLPLNPFSDDASSNVHTLKKAIKKLKNGEAIATFPAGEVSHRTWSNWSVNDPPWSQSIATMALRSNATVVPIYFHGKNSTLFQLSGLIHPLCRTMLLGRELTNKRGRCIKASIGKPVTIDKLKEFPDRTTLTEYLRGRVYMLADRKTVRPKDKTENTAKSLKRLLPEITVADRCADEIMALNERQQLVQSGNLTVYIAKSRQIPNILQEIGRLRELTFRAVGEGTGNDIDLDDFDRYYRHLFVWNHEEQEIVGAYRLGLTDEIMRTRGVRGLYTWTLFNFDKRLFESLGPAVELGRSFIRPEYQRNFKPLMLLWRGISKFICLKPKYRYFFGVVSISNEYSAASKRLMTDFVSSTRMVDDFQGFISARNPHQPKRARHFDLEPFRMMCTQLKDVEELVRDIENGRQGVPILLKQYLKLNAKLVTLFNVDKEFSDVIDGLMLVDFLDVDRRTLDWYFGKKEASSFLQYYGRGDDHTPPEQPPDSSADLGATG